MPRIFLTAFVLIAVWGATQTTSRAADLFVSYVYTDSVHRFGPVGNDLGTYGNTGGEYPEDLVFDSHGNLYVVNYGTGSNSKIHKFGPTGADLGTFATAGVNEGIGLAIDSFDNVYVANNGNASIHKFSPTGADLGTFASGANLVDIHDIVFGADGNLYAAMLRSPGVRPGTIRKFSPTGTDLGIFASTPDKLNGPDGLAFDSSGNLYATYYGDNAVRKFGPDGADLGIFASTGLNHPYGLAFDAPGNLYVANDGVGYLPTTDQNTIHKFGPDGTDLGTFISTGDGTGPEVLAFAPSAVPEPSTLALSACGLVALVLARRRPALKSPQMSSRQSLLNLTEKSL